MKIRHCLDLNQGSPVYYTDALTAKPQRNVIKQTMGENHFEKETW